MSADKLVQELREMREQQAVEEHRKAFAKIVNERKNMALFFGEGYIYDIQKRVIKTLTDMKEANKVDPNATVEFTFPNTFEENDVVFVLSALLVKPGFDIGWEGDQNDPRGILSKNDCYGAYQFKTPTIKSGGKQVLARDYTILVGKGI